MGLLILLGIEDADTQEDCSWLSSKIVNLRIFNDESGVMPARPEGVSRSGGNLSLKDVNGQLLLVSQFTLYASTKKGNRPSYIKAAKPEIAIPLYENMIITLQNDLGKPIQTGEFGADMNVALLNHGSVTIIIDTKNRE